MRSSIKLGIFVATLVFLAACGGTKEIEMDVQRLQVETRQMKNQLGSLVAKLNQINRRLETEVFPMAKNLSEYLLQIEKIESEMRINADKLDQNTYKLSQLSQQIADINYRMKSGSSSSSYPARTAVSPSSSVESRQYSSLTPNQIYQTAYADYLKGNYNLAIEGFREYLNRYPDSELAAAVQYWLGECYYARGDYKQAIDEFDKVIINYENDEKVKSAALKKGFALFELNQTGQGVIIMQQIIREFPHSKQARIAKEKLEGLGLKPQ